MTEAVCKAYRVIGNVEELLCEGSRDFCLGYLMSYSCHAKDSGKYYIMSNGMKANYVTANYVTE